jgi:cystathionine beta-lyase/cystathionine gamma-synthase
MSNEKKSAGFSTLAVHAGVEPDPGTGAIMTPVYLTSTYVQEGIGQHKGYEYSRSSNPTRDALETAFAALEGGKHGLAFASGLAAVDAVLMTLRPGDEVIAGDDLYGGTRRLFTTHYEPLGIRFHFVDTQNAANVGAALNDKTRLVWLETPTNPLMRITDITAVAALLSDHPAKLAVDNTFATPALQRPLEQGADIVMHSVTKYLGGHSDVVMGALMTKDTETDAALRTIQNNVGAIPGPMDCFLVLRGIKTLGIRVRQHCVNGRAIAEWLLAHPKVDQVYWPGNPQSVNHDVATRQMVDYGGMISFTLVDDSLAYSRKVCESTQVFALAESLGGVESLIEHPALMTHASVPADQRAMLGINDSLIRISCGIEDPEDLIADLSQALDA